MRRVILIMAVLITVAAAAAGWWGYTWLRSPIATLAANSIYEVPRGASLRGVAAELHRRGLIEHPNVWRVWARLTRRATSLKAGEYGLTAGLTPQSLLDLLNSGKVLLHSITFIEGSTFAEARVLLSRHEAVQVTLNDVSAADIMRKLGAADQHPEGQFFPDTYHFARGTTDIELLKVAHRRMQDELKAAWNSRIPDLPLATQYEALILASIVEKETALESERPVIAGVFVERLKRGMRLQTDPTVIYGMGETYAGDIRRVDLVRDTPYNTYTRRGLPPTPIALPGAESLRAAVNPQMTGAIFFVATGKGDGSHFFSSTLAEHQAAVRRYLQRQRESAVSQ